MNPPVCKRQRLCTHLEGTTSFCRKFVYYKWTIEDARLLLIDIKKMVQSPPFCIPGIRDHFELHASLSKFKKGYRRPSPKDSYLFQIDLSRAGQEVWSKDPNAADKNSSEPVNVLALSCSFSLQNPQSGDTKQATVSNQGLIVGTKGSTVTVFIEVEKEYLKNLIHNDSLTVICTGNFMLLDNAIESVVQEPCSAEPATTILKTMYKENLFSDIQIKVGDETFNAHRAVLSSYSSVFRRMFATDMIESELKQVEISDFAPLVVSDLLSFIYTGSAPQIKSHPRDLLIAADKYDMPHLVMLCEKELKNSVNTTNAAEILLLADSLELQASASLIDYCLQFIKQNAKAVFMTEAWKKLKESSTVLALNIMESSIQI